MPEIPKIPPDVRIIRIKNKKHEIPQQYKIVPETNREKWIMDSFHHIYFTEYKRLGFTESQLLMILARHFVTKTKVKREHLIFGYDTKKDTIR